MLAMKERAWKPEKSEQETMLNITAVATLTESHASASPCTTAKQHMLTCDKHF